MNNNRVFLDIHAIQILPPSNMNRDDSGSPKTAQYGGVRRARVSSQAWKRAMRRYFAEYSSEDLGIRTKHIVAYVADQICKLDETVTKQDAMSLAEDALELAGLKLDKKEKTAKALFFIGKKQAVAMAETALEHRNDKKEKKNKDEFHRVLSNNPEIDIALFGRMVADDQSLNEDASAQIAHAISTHAVQTEFDYYTAMDDMNPADQAGAGMIGTIEFNSSTMYRYGNIAVHELQRQLGDKEAAIAAIKLFVESFSNSLPTGKVNTFANQTLPQLIMVNIREDRPVNLVSAFENPVRSSDGYARESINRLFSELKRSEKFVHKPAASLYVVQNNDGITGEGKEEDSLSSLLNDLGSYIEPLL